MQRVISTSFINYYSFRNSYFTSRVIAQPAALLSTSTKCRRSISQYSCYHGEMAGRDAESRLKEMDGKHYLIRFSINHNEYMLSVSGRGEDNIPIFQHFTIKITHRYDQSEYEINGAGKTFPKCCSTTKRIRSVSSFTALENPISKGSQL